LDLAAPGTFFYRRARRGIARISFEFESGCFKLSSHESRPEQLFSNPTMARRIFFNVMTIYYYVWFGVLIVLLVLNVVAVVAGRNSA
jgi:hypothetical protein